MTRRQPKRLSIIGKRQPVCLMLGLMLQFFPTRLVRPIANAFGNTIAPGARIGFSLLIGTCVTKNLTDPRMYISGVLRMLPKFADPNSRTDIERIINPALIETVYRMRNARR